MNKIITNKAQCTKCGDIIESRHRHDFVWCKCGALAVDGGRDYLKRSGDIDGYIELSVTEPAIVSESKQGSELKDDRRAANTGRKKRNQARKSTT